MTVVANATQKKRTSNEKKKKKRKKKGRVGLGVQIIWENKSERTGKI